VTALCHCGQPIVANNRQDAPATQLELLSQPFLSTLASMKATEVIDEIKHLSPSEQAEVIRFAIGLARDRQLSGEELGQLADQLAKSEDPAEIARLRSAMTRGFYGA
jgi:hypothetical protein